MISLVQLSKHLGMRILFDGVSFNLNAGSRYGVVGANGSGKSTFLKIIAGEEQASDGKVTFMKGATIGMLRQDQFLKAEAIILHVAMEGQKAASEAIFEKERLLSQPMETEKYLYRLAELEETIAHLDGYILPSKAAEILEGLGIPAALHHQPLSVLSGGFRWRVLLAQLLVANPSILLLDEPTNHLDIVSIRWLEKFLHNFEGCALVISHDRRFLENVCNHILDVDYETISLYAGTYAEFEAQKQLRLEQREAENAAKEREIAHKQAFVDRFRATASKARQAQSRIKQIEKIVIEKLPSTSRRYPVVSFGMKRPSGKEVLTVEHLKKVYGDKTVLNGVSFRVNRGDRVGIIGANGIGKSTLLKILTGEVQADEGKFAWGYETQIGYFAQDHEADVRKVAMSLEDWLWRSCPQESKGFVRSFLGKVLFSGEDAEKNVTQLSGGEVARLVLAKLMIEKPNVLILDEPTNHLDMEAVETLVKALHNYEGTLIFVSHDRWFVGQLAHRVMELRSDGYNDFPGTFESYLDKCGDDHLDIQTALKQRKQEKQNAKVVAPLSSKTVTVSKERKNLHKQLTSRRDALLNEIARIEKSEQDLEELFAGPQFYVQNSAEQQKAFFDKKKRLEEEKKKNYVEWEKLEIQLEE